ncbi:transcriptional regulator, Crp/Fnr family [Formosa sp. Hel1_33_131]|nr:transcriptional regulator, Crp/Fnr family [Formosa sp. Hel1_33_131]
MVFSESFIVKHYNKGEYLLKADDLCDYVGFVDKGFFTFFYLIEGVQHIRGFFFPNEFISNYSCFLLENKSKFNIQALEDSSVTLIHRDALFRSYKKLPKVQELSRNIVENLYIEVSEKYESFFLKTAEERYLELINSRPTIIQRIPQYMIASYLGITPEGLSRIRKRLAKK